MPLLPLCAPLPRATTPTAAVQTYISEDPRAAAYQEQLNQLEAELAQERNAMKLG